ncbi:HindVP family restriction endonuclease [Armatimonas sp.]|uniref:HindVP family restriction endonuclease n=1 Tax=Armatimonas sp. TaxID=1872638 RepID=UPI00286BB191|nr:HindVP family restriction endonuclease [Armatimonas sp.]
MTDEIEPGLFGLQNNTNRDFRLQETWGKNQFPSSFPASLCCYFYSKGINANYLCFRNGESIVEEISIPDIFGKKPDDEDTFFAFESVYTPFNRYVIGNLPRTDLVVQEKKSGICLSGLEIKLTALPDNVTCNSTENLYGSEIVVRPDTIVYLACSIATSLNGKLGNILPNITVDDWEIPYQVLIKASELIDAIDSISISLNDSQSPFLLQPIWKTKGKSPELSENCLDIFVWSNAGFCRFISEIAKSNLNGSISRQMRTVIWLFKMLEGIKKVGQFDHKLIIDSMSFNNKNDKAFASSGNITNRFMRCDRLSKPILKKEEIKNIILGGGQNLLSPERRFDAIIYNSPELFK